MTRLADESSGEPSSNRIPDDQATASPTPVATSNAAVIVSSVFKGCLDQDGRHRVLSAHESDLEIEINVTICPSEPFGSPTPRAAARD
jgi:hypothetical protein